MKEQQNISNEKSKALILSNKFISDKNISGKILFRSLNNDNNIDSFRFSIEDDLYEYFKSSNLRTLIIELLNDLAFHRHENNIIPNHGGVIRIIKNEFDIDWLTENEISALFQKT